MDSRKIVFQETGIVLLGEIVCTALMCAVFALLDKFNLSVLYGGLIGLALATGNFFFMALSTSMAADKAQSQDVKGGQVMVRSSYTLRLVVMFIILFACGKSGLFNAFSLVLPLLFVRPTITVAEFFRKPGVNNHEC